MLMWHKFVSSIGPDARVPDISQVYQGEESENKNAFILDPVKSSNFCSYFQNERYSTWLLNPPKSSDNSCHYAEAVQMAFLSSAVDFKEIPA
jgi:hypothetical protein